MGTIPWLWGTAGLTAIAVADEVDTETARLLGHGAGVAGHFRAPSPALSKLVGSSRNGWTDWTHVPTGKTLAELREMLRDSLRDGAENDGDDDG